MHDRTRRSAFKFIALLSYTSSLHSHHKPNNRDHVLTFIFRCINLRRASNDIRCAPQRVQITPRNAIMAQDYNSKDQVNEPGILTGERERSRIGDGEAAEPDVPGLLEEV